MPVGPGQMGGHVSQQFLNRLDLPSSVIASGFQGGYIAPQIEDSFFLQLGRGRRDAGAAAGLLHQPGVGDLTIQFGHALEDGICPKPPLFHPGGSPVRLVVPHPF